METDIRKVKSTIITQNDKNKDEDSDHQKKNNTQR